MNYKQIAEKAIIKAANIGLDLQSHNGSMPAGHNGSRFHKETIVRNTAHWSITFFSAYKLTNDINFLIAGRKCINQILLPKWRPYGFTFFMRDYSKKDRCNGLIGQAWVLESLIFALKFYPDKYLEINKVISTVISAIDFNYKDFWRITEIDGSTKKCRTFNQELWISLIFCDYNSTKFDQQLSDNLKYWFSELNKQKIMHIKHNGIIGHYLKLQKKNVDLTDSYILLLMQVEPLIERFDLLKKFYLPHYQEYIKQSFGYNTFNLYAFAAIARSFPKLLSNSTIKMVKSLVQTFRVSKYVGLYPNSGYGFNYNPIGFEMAYVEKVFGGSDDNIKMWLNKQLKHYFSDSMCPKNTNDPAVLLARVYELYRLIELK